MKDSRKVVSIKSYSGIGLAGRYKIEVKLYGGGLYVSKGDGVSKEHADRVVDRISSAGCLHLDAIKRHWVWAGRDVK